MGKKSDLLFWLASDLQTSLVSIIGSKPAAQGNNSEANSADRFGLDYCPLTACVFPVPFPLVVEHLRGCSCLPHLPCVKQQSPGPAWNRPGSAWRGNWQCALQIACRGTASQRTRTPRARPPPLAELSSRNASLPISNSQPFSVPPPAGLHRSPPHPSLSHLPGLNRSNPFRLFLYSYSVSPTTPPLSFGPLSSCKTSFVGCKGLNCPRCSTHGCHTKVSVLFSILLLTNLPFFSLLGIVSRYDQGAPCGCRILSVWSLLIWSPSPCAAGVSLLCELLCVFWHSGCHFFSQTVIILTFFAALRGHFGI